MLQSTVNYDAATSARELRVGNPIHYDDVYVTVAAVILDADRSTAVIQTRDDDGRMRVVYIAYDVLVDTDTVIQYGVKRDDRRNVMPFHIAHGTTALSKAQAYMARYGGELMVRSVVPNDTSETGGLPVDDWAAA